MLNFNYSNCNFTATTVTHTYFYCFCIFAVKALIFWLNAPNWCYQLSEQFKVHRHNRNKKICYLSHVGISVQQLVLHISQFKLPFLFLFYFCSCKHNVVLKQLWEYCTHVAVLKTDNTKALEKNNNNNKNGNNLFLKTYCEHLCIFRTSSSPRASFQNFFDNVTILSKNQGKLVFSNNLLHTF